MAKVTIIVTKIKVSKFILPQFTNNYSCRTKLKQLSTLHYLRNNKLSLCQKLLDTIKRSSLSLRPCQNFCGLCSDIKVVGKALSNHTQQEGDWFCLNVVLDRGIVRVKACFFRFIEFGFRF